jgi:hypothetical protein
MIIKSDHGLKRKELIHLKRKTFDKVLIPTHQDTKTPKHVTPNHGCSTSLPLTHMFLKI